MDVRRALVQEMPYIVNCIYRNVGHDAFALVNAFYQLAEETISVNFDSENFYLTRYENRETTKLHFPICKQDTPSFLVHMILDMIKLGRMKQNIKNSDYLIHFRVFHDKVFLEDPANTLRTEAFLEVDRVITPILGSGYTISFLMSKITALQHQIVLKNDVAHTVLLERLSVIVRAIARRNLRYSASSSWFAQTKRS